MTAFNSKEGGFYLTTVGRVADPDARRPGGARGENPRLHPERLLGSARQVWRPSRRIPGRWFDPGFKKDDDPERRAERLWAATKAEAIVADCRGKSGIASEESRPSTQLSPLLFDLTSLQRDANARFGFPARMTLSLAQALYERHKVLTYPRTDARALPEDYVAR